MAETAGAASGHRVRGVLGRGLGARQIAAASGGRRIAGLQTRTGLAVAPGERRGAVGEAGDATRVGFVAVVADAAVQTAVDGKRVLLIHPKHNIIGLLDVRKATGTPKETDALSSSSVEEADCITRCTSSNE